MSNFGCPLRSLRRLRRFGFDAAPAHRPAADGFFHGAEKDHIHQLAVIEALQEHGDEQGPVFLALQSEGDDAGQHVNQQKPEEEKNGALKIGGVKELRSPGDMQLHKPQIRMEPRNIRSMMGEMSGRAS